MRDRSVLRESERSMRRWLRTTGAQPAVDRSLTPLIVQRLASSRRIRCAQALRSCGRKTGAKKTVLGRNQVLVDRHSDDCINADRVECMDLSLAANASGHNEPS